jgi:hypothetical protein
MYPYIPIIIACFTLINISSYYILLFHSPQYTVFLGTVHYPLDYLYYLSFITQGKTHWLRAYHLFTGERIRLEFLNWIYVLGGHIGSLFHLEPRIMYQVMVVGGSIIYLIMAYKLVCLLMPKNTSRQLMLFVLFLTSNAFPRIYEEGGKWIFSYYYPYNNFGHPFVRLSNVPHFLVIQTAIMATVYFAVLFRQKHSVRYGILLAITGLILGSLQPVQWAFMTGILALGMLIIHCTIWVTRSERSQLPLSKIINQLLPAFSLFVGGIIPALYLKHLFSLPPYADVALWENNQQIRISFWHFIRLNGPLMILAIAGLPFVVRKLSTASFIVILNAFLTALLFFSPIPSYMCIMNIRFISVLPTLAFAYISTIVHWDLAKRIDRARTAACAWLLAFLALAITIPATLRQLYERTQISPPQDVNTYLPAGAYQAFAVAARAAGERDIVLVEPTFTQAFAAISGRHVYASNSFATIDYERKSREVMDFFYNTKMTGQDRVAFLNKNNIRYIVGYAWAPLDLPKLISLYKNDYMILYKVE